MRDINVTGMTAMLPALGLSVALCMAAPFAMTDAMAQDMAEKQVEQQGEDADWRDALLAEMATIVNELDQQRRFNALLRDRVDILNHRIAQLEAVKTEQSDRIVELQKTQAEQQQAQLDLEKTQLELSRVQDELHDAQLILEKTQAQLKPVTKPDAVASAKKPEETQAPGAMPPAVRDGIKAKPESGPDGAFTAEFQKFLDMGEAMMRRFFGVVREYRKEYEKDRV